MPLTTPQKEVASSNKRFRVLCAGRRFGKSVLAIRELAKFARHDNKKVLYVAPTYQMCRNIVWGPLKTKLRELNWIKKVNESRLEIQLVNGSTIMLRGADNPDSLRGMGVSFICIDEVADIKPEAWTEVLRPSLSAESPPGSALFVGTPKGVGNHFKDLFEMADVDDNWQSWQYTTLEGENVSQSEVDAAKRDLDIRTFRQEFEASFETATNIVYYSFKAQNNVIKWTGSKNDLKSIYVMTDFNVSPMATLIAIPTTWGLHVIDEICLYSSNTDEMVQEVKNRYPHQKVTAYPDPAGIQRKTSAGGRTDISILQNAGWDVRYKPRHPAVKDRINAVNSLLLNSNGDSRLLIDPKCKQLIKCLTRFSYKENTLIPDTGGREDYSHFPDALGYGVEFMFPVTRQIKTQTKQTFGMY
jgi:hypothetical protein